MASDTFGYTGDQKTFVAPVSGDYHIVSYGAVSGSDINGAFGERRPS
jgi:hypothetical protein